MPTHEVTKDDASAVDAVPTREEVLQQCVKAREEGTTDELMSSYKGRIEKDPEFANQLYEVLAQVEEDDGPTYTGTSADDEKFLSRNDTLELEPNENKEQPKEGSEKQDLEDDPEYVKIEGEFKYKPEWLGTYGKGRSLSEALPEIHKGIKEKDKLIEFFKERHVPQLKKEVEEARAELERIRKEYESVSSQPKPEPSKTSEQAEDPASTEKVDIPPPPERPKMPRGDDRFDDDKMEEYENALEEYEKSVELRNQALLKKELEDLKKSALAAPSTEKDDEIERLKRELEDIRGTVTRQTSERSTNENFKRLDAFMAKAQDVFGEGRSVSEMEADYMNFLDVGSQLLEYGSPYTQNGALKPEVHRMVQEASDPNSATAVFLANNNVKLPEDFDRYSVLNKIYAVSQNSKISLDDALLLEKAKNPNIVKAESKPKEKSKIDTQRKELEARQRAKNQRGSYVKDINPGEGTSGSEVEDRVLTRKAVEVMTSKASRDWTGEERAIVQAYSDNHPEIGLWEIHEGVILDSGRRARG